MQATERKVRYTSNFTNTMDPYSGEIGEAGEMEPGEWVFFPDEPLGDDPEGIGFCVEESELDFLG